MFIAVLIGIYVLQLVKMQVDLTTSHLGYFEFRLCPKSSAKELVTQDCLDRNLLTLDDGSTRFPIPTFDPISYYPVVQLPKGNSRNESLCCTKTISVNAVLRRCHLRILRSSMVLPYRYNSSACMLV